MKSKEKILSKRDRCNGLFETETYAAKKLQLIWGTWPYNRERIGCQLLSVDGV